MDSHIADFIWRGIQAANPWWRTGTVPKERSPEFRRHAFHGIHAALQSCEVGRGVVVLGPRRVGKTVIAHQLVEQLLADGISPNEVCYIALDDVALRGRDIGDLIGLLESRNPAPAGRPRFLLLDEVRSYAVTG